jgi:hypothetical protein
MTTAIDTNVLVALWAGTPTVAATVRQALRDARERGLLLIAAPVYAELLAAPQWTIAMVDQLLHTMHVNVDWQIDEAPGDLLAQPIAAMRSVVVLNG